MSRPQIAEHPFLGNDVGFCRLVGWIYTCTFGYLNLRQQVQYRIDGGLMNIIKKTSVAPGGTAEKRIAYLFVAMERELKDLQFYVVSVS